jgi:hypothetical protein
VCLWPNALFTGDHFEWRVPMDDETKANVGIEASKLYYLFVEQVDLGREIVRQASPLLAALMSTQLDKIKLESVDHEEVFDGKVHERIAGSMIMSTEIKTPRSFLSLIKANGALRSRALVRT